MSPSFTWRSFGPGLRSFFRVLVQFVKNLWMTILFWFSLLFALGMAIYILDVHGEGIWSFLKQYSDYAAFTYRHPGLAALSVLLMGFVWGLAGTGLGLQNLFWPDRWTNRMYAGIAITLYFALIGILAHYEHLLRDNSVDAGRQPMEVEGLQAYLFRVGIPMIILILVPAAMPGFFPRLPRRIAIVWGRSVSAGQGFLDSYHRLRTWIASFLPTLAGVVVGSGLVVGLIEVSRLVTRVLPTSQFEGNPADVTFGESFIDLFLSDSFTSHLIRFYIIFSLVFFVGLAWLFYQAVTPAVAVCSLFSLVSVSTMLPEFLLHVNVFNSKEEKQAFADWCSLFLKLGFLVLPILVVIGLIARGTWRLFFYKPTGKGGEGESLGWRFRNQLLLGCVAILSAIATTTVGVNNTERWIAWVQENYHGLLSLLIWLSLALWVVLANGDPFKLQFPNMETYYPGGTRGTVDLRGYVRGLSESQPRSVLVSEDRPGDSPGGRSSDDPLDNRECLTHWLRYVRECRRQRGEPVEGWKPKLAVVTVSGGALRSAYWTSVVLKRISREIPDFGSHVRLIAGASGGMVGAAYFVGDMRAKVDHAAKVMPPMPMSSIDSVARYIALREVFKAFVPRSVLDVYHQVTGWPRSDRGIRLEQDWEGIDVPLRDYRADEAAGKIPSLVLSPMIVESGRRLLISNLDMRMATCTRGSEINESEDFREEPYSISALEFSRLFPEAREFHLSTAVRMSATFPFVSPAVNLPTSPPVRVVDAGYYDNYGVHCATSWLLDQVDWLAENTSGVVLIQIRDSLSYQDRLGVVDAPQGLGAKLGRGVQMLTSPLHAVAKARESSTSFRNDHDVMILSKAFSFLMSKRLENPREFFTSVTFENSASVSFRPRSAGEWPGDGLKSPRRERNVTDVSLNWYLSEAERQGLESAIPSPEPRSLWEQRDNRQKRIQEISEKADGAEGLERLSLHKELEQALNYERLVGLKNWWGGSPRKKADPGSNGDGEGSLPRPPVALHPASQPMGPEIE